MLHCAVADDTNFWVHSASNISNVTTRLGWQQQQRFALLSFLFSFSFWSVISNKRKRRSTVGMEVNKRPTKTKTKACSLRSFLSVTFFFVSQLSCLITKSSLSFLQHLFLSSLLFSFFSLQNSNVLYVSLLQQLKHTISDRF